MLRNCMCSYCSYHARMGWAWLHALSCHTCWMLRNCAYMLHATQLHVLVLFVSCTDGVGVVACVVLSHMLDATELRIHVTCYATACARTVRIMHGWGGRGCMRCLVTHVGCYGTAHTCYMLRNCMCSYCSYQFASVSHNKVQFNKRHSKTRLTDRHSSARQSLVAFEGKCIKKPVAVEASLIDASILEWNSTCTATCGISTTETGGKISESCASNDEKTKKTTQEVFFWLGRASQCKIAEIKPRNQF